MDRGELLDSVIPHFLMGHGPLSVSQIVERVGRVTGAGERAVRDSMQRLAILELISTVPDGRWVANQPKEI